MFGTPSSAPLKVFVHVPKTAGSTVNAYLSAWAPGQDHVEQFETKPAPFQRKLRRLSWISGHLALNRMQGLLAGTSRPAEYYGLIREPVRQIASQYNWLMEIGHRGGRFFRGHPKGIQDYSDRLRNSDNTDPDVVIANIEAKPGLFLNLQSRFLLGDDLKFKEDTGLARFHQYAGLSCDPLALAAQMTGNMPDEQRRENASPYHFDRAVFDTDQLQDFLHRRHAYDLQLFARIAAGS